MDPAQVAQMIAWLDEEQRKGKAQIAELRDLLQKQAIELGDQRKRFEDLQSRLTRLQGDVSRASQMDQAVQQIRNELASVLHDLREELRRSDQQALQARQLERENDAKAILEISQRMERFLTLEDKLASQATEQQRLNEVLAGLRQRADSLDKQLSRHMEQERLEQEEQKREASRLDAIQKSIDDLRALVEPYSGRLQYLERWVQNSAQRTAELQAFRADMQRLQGELQEAQRRSEQRVEKQVRDWATISESIRRDQETWANQMRIFAEQHERTKKALAPIPDLMKELRLAQEQARQATELSIEKQRRELREWQGENEKRWTRYLAQWEYRWDEQRKTDEGLTARIEGLEAGRAPIQQRLDELQALLIEEMAAVRAAIQELWDFQLQVAQQEADAAKSMLEQLRARLER